jgi:hypothetical protein
MAWLNDAAIDCVKYYSSYKMARANHEALK